MQAANNISSPSRTTKAHIVLFTQVALSPSEAVPWLRGKPLMLLLLSVVVPEQNNCIAFVCFPHLLPLSRPKATDFV